MDFLSGWDVLALGCTSKAMRAEVDREQRVWKKRLPVEHTQAQNREHSWKHRYANAQSVRLNGGDRQDAIPLPADTAEKWQSEAFSIDMWFCMLPSSSSMASTGGVLLGAQSSIDPTKENDGPSQPEYHQQLIHVDSSGNLYCSVTKNKRIIKSKLQLERWYHIALTFSKGLQCVYLNGALLQVIREPLHVEWGKMKELQFGSGFMTYGSKGRPSDTFVGWYGFHGLLDAYRVWNHALSMGDVHRLARGQRAASRPAWSHEHTTERKVTQLLVRCSRPLERHCTRVASN